MLDLSVHFDDIRETLDGQAPRSGDDLFRSLELFHGLQATRLHRAGVPPVALAPTDGAMIGDDSEPVVSGTTYDLLRATASRRTRDQASQVLQWGKTPRSLVDVFPVYGWPEEPGGG